MSSSCVIPDAHVAAVREREPTEHLAFRQVLTRAQRHASHAARVPRRKSIPAGYPRRSSESDAGPTFTCDVVPFVGRSRVSRGGRPARQVPASGIAAAYSVSRRASAMRSTTSACERREALIQGHQAPTVGPGAGHQVGIGHLAMSHHASQGQRVIWSVIRPEDVPRMADPSLEDRHGVVRTHATSDEVSKKRALGGRRRREGSLRRVEPGGHQLAVDVSVVPKRDEDVPIEKVRHHSSSRLLTSSLVTTRPKCATGIPDRESI